MVEFGEADDPAAARGIQVWHVEGNGIELAVAEDGPFGSESLAALSGCMERDGVLLTRGGCTLAIRFGLTELVEDLLPATGDGFAAVLPT